MSRTIKVPDNLIDEEQFKNLPPSDKSLYMEKIIGQILDLNVNAGVTIRDVLDNTYFDRRGVSKYLEKQVARRFAYKVQQGKTIVYFKNGRLIHHLFNRNIELEDKLYSFKALFNGNQIMIYIQENRKNKLGVIEEGGGILIPLKHMKEFSDYVSKVENEIPVIKKELVRLIE